MATLLLTLVSYSVYKIRQLPVDGKSKASPVKVEGAFFKRYLTSSLRSEYFPQNSAAKQSKNAFFDSINKKLGLFFGIICTIIFASFMFEVLVTHDVHFFDEKEYTARVKALHAKGIFEHYDFNRSFDNVNLEETVPNATVPQLDYLLTELRKRTIQLFTTEQNQRFNPVASRLALSAWTTFLKSHQIAYSFTSSIPAPYRNIILVLPQVSVLSNAQRTQLESYVAQSGIVLATGPIGVLDGEGKQSSSSTWSNTVFSVQFTAATDEQRKSNTWFSGGGAPWWEIPPGTQIPWQIIDSRYQANMSADATAAMWEIRNVHGGSNSRTPRSVLSNGKNKRTAWTLLDPVSHLHETKSAVEVYQDLAFISLLAWEAGIPIAKVATWPDGKTSAIVPTVEIQAVDSDTKNLAVKLNELKIPTSYFVNVDQMKPFESLQKRLNQTEIIPALNAQTELPSLYLKGQFEQIERARLETEYYTGNPTIGFHVLNGSYDLNTIKALMQNHIRYLSGDTQYFQLAPTFISNGELMVLPGSYANEIDVNNKKESNDIVELKGKFDSVIDTTSALQGMYVFQIHPEVYAEKGYSIVIPETLKRLEQDPNTVILSMSDSVRWWKARNQLGVTIKRSDKDRLQISLVNSSSDKVSKVSVWFDDGKEAKLIPVGDLGGLVESNIDVQQ